MDGGAVYFYALNGNLNNCTFESNSADYYGGAVAYDGCLVQSVEDSVFILNTARNGGAISFAGYDDACPFQCLELITAHL